MLGIPETPLCRGTQESRLEDVESSFRDDFEFLKHWLPDSLADIEGKWDKSSCAVVGSSGNLYHTQYGQDIDKHGMVFRLNRVSGRLLLAGLYCRGWGSEHLRWGVNGHIVQLSAMGFG